MGVAVLAVVSDRTHHVHLLSFIVHNGATHAGSQIKSENTPANFLQ